MSKDDIWFINEMKSRVKEAVSMQQFDIKDIEDLIKIIDELIKEDNDNE